LDDVRMLQPGNGLGFRAETGEFLRAGMRLGQDHFERDRAIQSRLPRLIDDAHRAASQLTRELILPDVVRQGGGLFGGSRCWPVEIAAGGYSAHFGHIQRPGRSCFLVSQWRVARASDGALLIWHAASRWKIRGTNRSLRWRQGGKWLWGTLFGSGHIP